MRLIWVLLISISLVGCDLLRPEGGAGPLVGEWRLDLASSDLEFGVGLNTSSSDLIRITARGKNGVTIEQPLYETVCDLELNGEEHECRSPAVPEGLTFSLVRTESREFSYTLRIGSEHPETGTLTVSEDGRTITHESQCSGSGGPLTSIYRKQS